MFSTPFVDAFGTHTSHRLFLSFVFLSMLFLDHTTIGVFVVAVVSIAQSLFLFFVRYVCEGESGPAILFFGILWRRCSIIKKAGRNGD